MDSWITLVKSDNDTVPGITSSDLIHEFPEMKGFSNQEPENICGNLPGHGVAQQLCRSCLHKLPVSSYCILDNVRILKEREWYIRETIRFGLSHRGPQTPICPIRIS